MSVACECCVLSGTQCGVSECNHESLKIRVCGPLGSVAQWYKKLRYNHCHKIANSNLGNTVMAFN